LPGRSARLTEAPISCLVTLAQLTADALVPALDKPVAIFGHSMGALLGFEVARHLRRYGRLPIHLFVQGCPAPHTIRNAQNIHELAESDFLAELVRLNGTPPEVLDNEDLMQLFLPILRADFAAFERYRYVHEAPLGHPITAFGGTDDSDVSSEELVAWKQQTTAGFTLTMIAGGHFLPAFSQGLMLQKIAEVLSEDSCRSRGD
jgi:medium-chain acyl-[acyl-carrier-protein] hydrolase